MGMIVVALCSMLMLQVCSASMPDDVGEIKAMLKSIVAQQQTMLARIEKLESKWLYQEEEMSKLKADVEILNKNHVRQKVKESPEVKRAYSAFGCLADTLQLSCADSTAIFVTSADFGKYDHTCDVNCCAPHPTRDCVELVEENQPEVWAALKILCDNQTNCEYSYNGAVVESCEAEYVADYMIVYYSCTPVDENEPVGFSVRTDEDRYYADRALVLFDEAGYNPGGHFQLSTSTFLCPFDGVYLFSIGFNSAGNSSTHLDMKHGTARIASASTHVGENLLREQAANVAIGECLQGEVVFMETRGGGSGVYGSYDTAVFSGYLLDRYV